MVQRVVADVGHASDLLATIVATSTVHTAVISQKRENISVSDEMSPTTRETLCKNGFVIKRTNVIRKTKKNQRKNGILSSDLSTFIHISVFPFAAFIAGPGSSASPVQAPPFQSWFRAWLASSASERRSKPSRSFLVGCHRSSAIQVSAL